LTPANPLRLIKQLFKLAREKKSSIIFIDEIDALCGSRDAPGANPHTLGLKTELLVQMDGVGNDNDGVLLLGATNLPWTLDPAVRRRFQRKIHIPLPDEKARRQLFKISAEKMGVPLAKGDYIELASMTDGFSGSDISNALQDALDVPIKTVQNASFYRKVSGVKFAKRLAANDCARCKRMERSCSRRARRAMEARSK
jgi:vacuolar protein-sorting-associated protein 4